MSLSSEWISTLQSAGFKNRYFLVRHGESEANVAKLVSSIYSVSVAKHGLTELGVSQAKNAANVFEQIASAPTPEQDVLGSRVVSKPSKQQEKSENKDITTPSTDPLIFNPLNVSNILFYVSDFKRAYFTGLNLKQTLEEHHKKALEDELKKTQPQLDAFKPAFIPDDDATKKTQSVGVPTEFIPFYSTPALRERFFGVFDNSCPSDDIYDKVWAQDKTNEPESNHFSVESIQNVVTRTTELLLELEDTWSDKIIILVSHGDVAQILLAVCAAIDPRFHRSLPHMGNCDVRELLFVNGGGEQIREATGEMSQ